MGTGFTRRHGLVAAATLAAGGVIAGVSVAGAAQEVTIYVSDANGTCFTLEANKAACDPGERADVRIRTGETVTWDFAGSTSVHNAQSVTPNGSTPPNPAWDGRKRPPFVSSGTDSWTFGTAGVYEFVCGAHSNMVGTVTVEGDPVATATPDEPPEDEPPAPSPSATATPTQVRSTDDHTSTPAPGHASVKDSVAPRLASARVKRVRAGVQLRFWLSEPAKVSISASRNGSKAVATSATVQAPAGTRSLVLRTKAFRKGTYTVRFAPVDAMGNKGGVVSKTLKVK